MTDGQWLYMLANMAVDDEEEMNKICVSCKTKHREPKCTVCGKAREVEVNPSFDEQKFEELKRKSGGAE